MTLHTPDPLIILHSLSTFLYTLPYLYLPPLNILFSLVFSLPTHLPLPLPSDYHGYKSSDPAINFFWTVLRNFSKEEKALFLQFVTGTSKVLIVPPCPFPPPFLSDGIVFADLTY